MLMAKGRIAPKELDYMSQHGFRSKRREMARQARDAKLLSAQLELAHVKYENWFLQQKFLEVVAEVHAWRDDWAQNNQDNMSEKDNMYMDIKGENDVVTGTSLYVSPSAKAAEQKDTEVLDALLQQSEGEPLMMSKIGCTEVTKVESGMDFGTCDARLDVDPASEEDVALIMAQTECSHSVAAAVLRDHGSDIVDALFALRP